METFPFILQFISVVLDSQITILVMSILVEILTVGLFILDNHKIFSNWQIKCRHCLYYIALGNAIPNYWRP